MKLEVTMDMGNAAFEDQPASEAARILRDLADRLEDGGEVGAVLRLCDYNGNQVGQAVVKEG